MIRPASAMPFPPRSGFRRMARRARWPHTIPGTHPNGPRRMLEQLSSRDATARPDSSLLPLPSSRSADLSSSAASGLISPDAGDLSACGTSSGGETLAEPVARARDAGGASGTLPPTGRLAAPRPTDDQVVDAERQQDRQTKDEEDPQPDGQGGAGGRLHDGIKGKRDDGHRRHDDQHVQQQQRERNRIEQGQTQSVQSARGMANLGNGNRAQDRGAERRGDAQHEGDNDKKYANRLEHLLKGRHRGRLGNNIQRCSPDHNQNGSHEKKRRPDRPHDGQPREPRRDTGPCATGSASARRRRVGILYVVCRQGTGGASGTQSTGGASGTRRRVGNRLDSRLQLAHLLIPTLGFLLQRRSTTSSSRTLISTFFEGGANFPIGNSPVNIW